MKKPDRFERQVEKLPMSYNGFPSTVRRADVAPLLRRQHAAFVRLVRREIATRTAEIRAIDDGYGDRNLNAPAEVHAIQREMQGLRDLLGTLSRYKKGQL